MAITRVTTVGVYVSDQQAALDFYKNKLGFEVRQDMPMGGPGSPRWIRSPAARRRDRHCAQHARKAWAGTRSASARSPTSF